MSAPAPFDGLRLFGYDIIYADPPWPFENYSTKGESRNPNNHYATMSIEQIAALPVGHLASRDCALLLWAVDPLLPQAFEVMRAWGFDYKTVAFTWAKRTKLDTGWHMGTGYHTRANPETCLLGLTGSLQRRSAAIRQLVVEPIREHSRKPDRIADDIVRLYGDRPRVELFARTKRLGWEAWGNQVERFAENEGAPLSTAKESGAQLFRRETDRQDRSRMHSRSIHRPQARESLKNNGTAGAFSLGLWDRRPHTDLTANHQPETKHDSDNSI